MHVNLADFVKVTPRHSVVLFGKDNARLKDGRPVGILLKECGDGAYANKWAVEFTSWLEAVVEKAIAAEREVWLTAAEAD